MANGKSKGLSPFTALLGPAGVGAYLGNKLGRYALNKYRGNQASTTPQGDDIGGTFAGAPNMGGFGGGGDQEMNPVMQELLKNIPSHDGSVPVGEGAAGGGTMKPYDELKSEELDQWMIKHGDANSERSAANQYANAAALANADQASSTFGTQPTGTFDPSTIAQNQLSTNPNQPATNPTTTPPAAAATTSQSPAQPPAGKQGPLQYNFGNFQKEWKKRAVAGGYMEDDTKSEEDAPWKVRDIDRDKWHDWKYGMLVDPEDPEYRKKMMDHAMVGEEGDQYLDAERWGKVQSYGEDQTTNPYYKQHIENTEKDYQSQYDDSLGAKINKYNVLNPLGMAMHHTGLSKYLYGKSRRFGDYIGATDRPMTPERKYP